MAGKESDGTNAVVAELIALKKLLVLALTEGVQKKLSQDVIARALGVDQASVSRLVKPPAPNPRNARKPPKRR